MGVNGQKGSKRLYSALSNSIHGMKTCFRTEEAFRQEILLCIVLIPLSFFIAGNLNEWLLLNGSLAMVLVVELLNTGIERAIDRISFDRHELSRDAKDMGSAAVLLSLVIFVLCWGAILVF